VEGRGIVLGEGQDHVRPHLELQIDLSTGPPLYLPSIGLLTMGPASSLSAAAIEDHLDVPVVAEPIQQILVQAGFVARDEKQMSGHRLVYCLSTLCIAGHFFLT
jgi:hypothetical protein